MFVRLLPASTLAVLALACAAPVSAAPDAAAPGDDLMAIHTTGGATAPAASNMSGKPASPAPAAGAKTEPAQPNPDWRARVAIGVDGLQASDRPLFDRLSALQPDRKVEDEMFFSQPGLHDPRVAAVFLRRLLQGSDPVKVRCALVDALPATGGDWQEGAAAMIAIDASPKVRKKLVEVMRYAQPPHSTRGLRLGFKDDNAEVNVAAARTAGFSRSGAELYPELYSSTFDADWDLRAAAVQSLGKLRLPQSREVLVKALDDDEREVRLQALLALEELDPEGLIWLPQLDKLAKDRESHRIARKADQLLRKRRDAEKAAKRGKRARAQPPAAAG